MDPKLYKTKKTDHSLSKIRVGIILALNTCILISSFRVRYSSLSFYVVNDTCSPFQLCESSSFEQYQRKRRGVNLLLENWKYQSCGFVSDKKLIRIQSSIFLSQYLMVKLCVKSCNAWNILYLLYYVVTSYDITDIEMCDRYDMMRDASRNHNISRPISSRKIKLVLAELEWLCRTLFAEGGQIGSQDPSATRVFPGCNIMTGCCDTAQPTGSGVMVTVRRQTSAARVSPGVESVMAQMLRHLPNPHQGW